MSALFVLPVKQAAERVYYTLVISRDRNKSVDETDTSLRSPGYAPADEQRSAVENVCNTNSRRDICKFRRVIVAKNELVHRAVNCAVKEANLNSDQYLDSAEFENAIKLARSYWDKIIANGTNGSGLLSDQKLKDILQQLKSGCNYFQDVSVPTEPRSPHSFEKPPQDL